MKSKQSIVIGVIIIIILVVGIGYMLTPGGDAGKSGDNGGLVSNKPVVSDEDKLAISTAIINQQTIFLSKDPARIRAYFVKLSTSEQDKKDFTNMSNQTLLKIAAGASMFGKVTPEDFKFAGIVWNIGPDIAVVRLPQLGTTGSSTAVATFTVQKVDGVWF